VRDADHSSAGGLTRLDGGRGVDASERRSRTSALGKSRYDDG